MIVHSRVPRTYTCPYTRTRRLQHTEALKQYAHYLPTTSLSAQIESPRQIESPKHLFDTPSIVNDTDRMTESNASVGFTEGPMESTISKPKPLLKCSHCGKTFSTRKLSVLQAHERMHTGELPFECLEIGCNKRFSRKDSMMVHYLKHARVHSCTVKSCRMTFGSAIDLFRHQRFHQIQCSTCGISCETVPLLRMHKLKAHNESDFKCSVGENVLPLVTRNR